MTADKREFPDEQVMTCQNCEILVAYQTLQVHSDQKDFVLAAAAHDLRNALARIVSAQRLLKSRHSGLDDQADGLLTLIGQTAQETCALLEELLLVARLEQGGPASKAPVRMNWAESVEDALQACAQQARDKRLQLLWEPPAEPVEVLLYPGWMLRVLDNLLSNALKFTPAGGSIRLSLGRRDQQAWLEIADSGIGVPPDLQPVLFEKFSRARRQGLAGEPSTGLGLFIVSEMVRLHRGTITLVGEAETGSRFRIELPLA